MFLIFDTETTGLPRNYKAPLTDFDNWPRVVQIAWQLHDDKGELVEVKNFIIKPNGFTIPFNSEKIHGISTERATKFGVDLDFVLDELESVLKQTKFNVGHNIEFDLNIMGSEFLRAGRENPLAKMESLDTMKQTVNFCAIPGGRGGGFKYPNLSELYLKIFGEKFKEAHNASADVEATSRAFLELVRKSVIPPKKLHFTREQFSAFQEFNPETIQLLGLNIKPYDPEEIDVDADVEQVETEVIEKDIVTEVSKELIDVPFSHLHNHTQYSVLQATSKIDDLINKAVKNRMPAIAITDLGNMYGAFQFVSKILKHNKGVDAENKEAIEKGETPEGHKIKPIVGCEFYVCKDHKDKSNKDNGYQIVVLAKSKKGYHNLTKLASASFVDGYYYVPRIDKKLLLQYKEDLIVTTGGLYGEVPGLILNTGETQALDAFLWWKEQFGEDFYVELVRHKIEEEDRANEVMIKWAKEYDVKYFAANNTFYVEQTDSIALDALLCIREGEKVGTPIGRGRGFRYGFSNDEFYFKSSLQMKAMFVDLPEAIETTNEIISKIEEYTLARDVLLPNFEIPTEFIDPEDEKDGGKRGENAYLKHLTFNGAKNRYSEIDEELKKRIDFELQIIENTGYPGYFLIVQDFTRKAREMGVWVGPGRGSAAGSVVAYCIEITNVDPIKYDLLFERFLNPDRVSMPDIDIDFDDEGRGKIIDWVVDKYGSDQVAQIITYGTMAAKSSVRDTGRVLDLSLQETDQLAKLLPDNVGLNKIFSFNDKELKTKIRNDDYENVKTFIDKSNDDNLAGQTINLARKIEGSLRNIGTHACGIIIAPDDLTNYVPVAKPKGSDLLVTQFDNAVVESAGLLKMDFLGLKTLSILKDAIALIKERHGIAIDPDEIPLDDEKTYKLYQKGYTNGTFQFESRGMQKHLRGLQPDKFEDLIAMNALFRPGPMEYIPEFIARKNGEKEIEYDVPEMEEYLAETYGITVYQEQVMLLSQKLAGFTKGEADTLRKAMGKKIRSLLDQMKPKFISGCVARNIEEFKAEKIWRDWEAFAQYAFNKSHSTCYSVIAYQTAYLKANYPAEYMAAVLTHNMNDIKKVTFFMEECRRMGLIVLGPCVNESGLKFRVNEEGFIRFGLGGIKGVGEGAVESMIKERNENGVYKSIWDLTGRAESNQVNKRVLESLAFGGAMDVFGLNRSQYFVADQKNGRTFIETGIRYGARIKENKNSMQQSLFGGSGSEDIPPPNPPEAEEWPIFDKLKKEREVVGIFISGHPLDDFSLEIEQFCRNSTKDLVDLKELKKITKRITLAGMITHVEHRISQKGKPWGKFTLEDYDGHHEFTLFGNDYVNHKNMMNQDWFVFIEADLFYNDYYQRMELKIIKITILPELIHEKAKSLEIELNAGKITEATVEELNSVLDGQVGKLSVRVKLIDEKSQIALKSRKKGISINKEMAERLKKIDNLKFKLA
jgi:DNA polymerase-3 subunit alpha